VGDGWVWFRIVLVIYDLAILLAQYLVWCWVQGKGKAIPLQVWRGREVSRRLRLPDLKTISLKIKRIA
jgi:hypothetical protein